MIRSKWFLTFLLIITLPTANGAFLEKHHRYLSPKDIFSLLNQKFPILNKIEITTRLESTCWNIEDSNLNFIGANSPVLGRPATAQPNTAFVRWYGSCLDAIINLQFEDLKQNPKDKKLWGKFLPAPLLVKYQATALSLSWSQLSNAEQNSIFIFLIEELIGPLRHTTELNSIIKKAVEPNNATTVGEVTKKILLAIALREEFITY